MFSRTTPLLILQAFCLFLTLSNTANALQPATRRSFVSKFVAAGTTAGIVAASSQNAAWAAEKPQYTGAKAGFDNRPKRSSAFRGGQEAAASTHDGTDLNDAEASVAGGLLEKMGLADEKGANDRSSDRRKAYGSK